MVLTRSAVFARVILAAALVLAAACSTDRGADELFAPGGAGVPVVDAVLVVGELFPDLYLTRSLAPNESFTLARAGISGATVTIRGAGTTMVYLAGGGPGQYSPPVTAAVIQPSTRYDLTVDLPDGGTLRASTTTPARIQVREWVLLDEDGSSVLQRMSTFGDHGDTVYFQPENQLVYPDGLVEIRLDAAPAPGYQVGLASIDLGSSLLIDADFLDEEDLDEFTRTNSSPPVEAESASIRVPWFAIYYEGRYKMRVFAMDRNWFDLARTDPVLGAGGIGFGGEAGDAFTRPIFHVEGGIGLFGSMSVDSVGFYVNPPGP
jgi:hypothetical protein